MLASSCAGYEPAIKDILGTIGLAMKEYAPGLLPVVRSDAACPVESAAARAVLNSCRYPQGLNVQEMYYNQVVVREQDLSPIKGERDVFACNSDLAVICGNTGRGATVRVAELNNITVKTRRVSGAQRSSQERDPRIYKFSGCQVNPQSHVFF